MEWIKSNLSYCAMKHRKRKGKKEQKKVSRFNKLSMYSLTIKFKAYYTDKAKIKACLKQMTR